MPAVPRLSVEEYEQMVETGLLPKRAELIRGIIVERPSRTPLHVYLAHWLYDHFYEHLPSDYAVYQLAPLRLADSEPELDIIVIPKPGTKFRAQHPTTALLAITIVTVSVPLNLEYALLCAEADVPEHWVILADSKQVEVKRSPVNGEYCEQHIFNLGETLVCSSVPKLSVRLDELFA